LLSRIPAVKWAFTRLRPLPQNGSIDVAPVTADEAAAVVAEAAPALDGISAEPTPRDADIEVAAQVAEESTTSVIAESLSVAPATEIGLDEASSLEAPAEIEPAVTEEVLVASTDDEPKTDELKTDDVAEPIGSDPLAELLSYLEPEIVEAASVPSIDHEAVDAPESVVNGDPSPEHPVDVEPGTAEHVLIAPAETETTPVEASDPAVEDEPALAAEIEPVLADDPSPVTLVVAESSAADAPIVDARVEPAPVSAAPKSPSAPKLRTKIAEPADRATLIRQRWAETGIRMWNPRLHGTGDATLNIQGRIELLPPEPGETMPRYDKLEFKMLGGQIVCEGVIVDAPVHASQRSFTRLAEPRSADRTREPTRERQAALA
jgi:hypothetical protein